MTAETLKQRIDRETKAALLGGDRFVGETLRNLKAAILNEEVAKGKRDDGLNDAEVEAVVAREVKKRVESAKVYRDNDRVDLAKPEEQEVAVLKTLLPEQLSADDVASAVQTKIAELGVSGPQAMGQVIGALKSQYGSRIDGALLAQTVKEQLTT